MSGSSQPSPILDPDVSGDPIEFSRSIAALAVRVNEVAELLSSGHVEQAKIAGRRIAADAVNLIAQNYSHLRVENDGRHKGRIVAEHQAGFPGFFPKARDLVNEFLALDVVSEGVRDVLRASGVNLDPRKAPVDVEMTRVSLMGLLIGHGGPEVRSLALASGDYLESPAFNGNPKLASNRPLAKVFGSGPFTLTGR